MDLKGKYTHIFFDADDTLWENEQFFRDAEAEFAEMIITSSNGLLLWSVGVAAILSMTSIPSNTSP